MSFELQVFLGSFLASATFGLISLIVLWIIGFFAKRGGE